MKSNARLMMLAMSLLIGTLTTAACKSAGQTPEDIANAFVTAYYVDANLDQALNYCEGLACQKLRDEMTLRDGQQITQDTYHPEIMAKRTQILEEAGGAKRFVYTLIVKPKDVDAFQRDAYVKLRQNDSGTWKVSLFAEIPMTPPQGP